MSDWHVVFTIFCCWMSAKLGDLPSIAVVFIHMKREAVLVKKHPSCLWSMNPVWWLRLNYTQQVLHIFLTTQVPASMGFGSSGTVLKPTNHVPGKCWCHCAIDLPFNTIIQAVCLLQHAFDPSVLYDYKPHEESRRDDDAASISRD